MPSWRAAAVSLAAASALSLAGCSAADQGTRPGAAPVREPQTAPGSVLATGPSPALASQPSSGRAIRSSPAATATHPSAARSGSASASSASRPQPGGRRYPLHTGIIATTFWVGEIFDPNASDGSQVLSTYDGQWMKHYGGCDGVAKQGSCQTQARTAAKSYFPTTMTPRQNPFYLDLPFDDINDAAAFAQRARVIPWANDPGYRGHASDQGFSYMKNRWVQLTRNGRTCYGQIEDAGPGDYDDSAYVFGSDNRRPANKRYNNAGLDVSPALTSCLGFTELNGDDDKVDWRFVDTASVPRGPWTKLVTTQGLTE